MSGLAFDAAALDGASRHVVAALCQMSDQDEPHASRQWMVTGGWSLGTMVGPCIADGEKWSWPGLPAAGRSRSKEPSGESVPETTDDEGPTSEYLGRHTWARTFLIAT